MSLISGLIELLGTLESDRIAIHEERCISVRNRNADCLRCADACTSEVISYRDNELTLDPDRCIGCGTCATACPTCAIEIKDPSDDELTKRAKASIVATKGHPVFACEIAAKAAVGFDETMACVLPCLGRIDESLLVGMAAYRAFDVTLVCGTCDTCAHAPGGAMVRSVIDSSRSLLDAFGSSMPIELADALPSRVCEQPRSRTASAAPDGASRRDFLKSVTNASAEAAATAVEGTIARPAEQPVKDPPAYRKVGANGTLSHFVPTRRTRVYNYLNHIGEPVAETIETRIVGAVAIDTETCSSCRMCAVFCPTGALAKLDGEDAFGILHRPSACMQCRLCESICPENAITVSATVPTAQFMGKTAVCFAMKRPNWTANKPDSMFKKVHSLIGDDKEMCMF